MIAALRLGLRLAGGGAATRGSRVRSLMVAVAAGVGVLLMLAVLAIAHSETGRRDHGLVSDSGVSLMLATVVVTVGLPVLVLAATAGRLAAAVRDRRLANLRLLGMTPGRTRAVAAVETGAVAVIGAAVGWLLFLALRSLLVVADPVGREWELGTFTPTLTGYAVVLLAVPAAVTLVSAWPGRRAPSEDLAVARRAHSRPPSRWRLAPLAFGAALTGFVFVMSPPPGRAASIDLSVPMFAAIISLGLGVVLVVPVFVRLVADLLVRRRQSPAAVIAGRRLQDQPVATTRLVAGLLIGLFLVTGARAIVVAFEQTNQYQSAASLRATGQVGTELTSPSLAESLQETLAGIDGVRAVETFAYLRTGCGKNGPCHTALVGTCEDLAHVAGPLPTCLPGEPAWLGPGWADNRKSMTVRAYEPEGTVAQHSHVRIPAPTYSLPRSAYDAVDAQVFIPRSTPAISDLVSATSVQVVVAAEPGVLLSSLSTAESDWTGTGPAPMLVEVDGRTVVISTPYMAYYDFVAGLRQIVWAVAAVILSVGLLAFAIGAIDRAMSRRAEMVSLQLTGVSPRVLRRTQWIEAALPLGAGVVLAVGTGFLAGACYLAFGTELVNAPWQQSLTLLAVSVVASGGVAGLTVLAVSPRVRPELIRSE